MESFVAGVCGGDEGDMIQKFLFFLRKLTPTWTFKMYHFVLAFVGHAIYGFPSRKLVVFGVTGTNGKTTTSFALAHILCKAGYRVAVSSSAQFQIGDRVEPNSLMISMPGRFKLAKFLSDAVADGCQIVIVESTSEGVLQYRHRFIDYDFFLVTNLRPEHIERHGSFEKYKRAKLELVRRLMIEGKKVVEIVQCSPRKLESSDVTSEDHPDSRPLKEPNTNAHQNFLRQSSEENWQSLQLRRGGGSGGKGIVVNLDDEYAKEFLNAAGDVRKVGVTFQESRIESRESRSIIRDSIFTIQLSWSGSGIGYDGALYPLGIPGSFNAYNVSLAAAASMLLGLPFAHALESISDFRGVPGRFEVLHNGNVSVIVDYAHEPFSLEQVLKLAKSMYSGMLVHVFGATGGGRDVWKRALMGEVSGRFADRIILTNDDPYDENQEEIANQIRSGVKNQSNVELTLDRTQAIGKAIGYAREQGGVVVVTGKGTENLMCFEKGRKIPWSDKAVVERALNRTSATL